ncbi:carboxymuconolactone decarboxylase family protein [Pseudonocardia xishanensis]|uniref:Carboxymuconolactone decarboxylase-like domain-containing protein n=1 Tax=Pseudonocardia xishanensis TaxID=630995 RepID=A0ABP8RCG2_9PSEU
MTTQHERTQHDQTRRTPTLVSLARLREEAEALLADAPEGTDLDEVSVALIRLAVNASVTTLDPDGIDREVRGALDAGATAAEVHETLVVVSGLGVHTLMEGSRRVVAALRERGEPAAEAPLDEQRLALRAQRVGDDPYWADFDREVPGFLDALLRQSPEAYEAFFDYCAVPWRTGAVRGRVKELMSLAADATPTHRYLPGMRMHLANALRLGVGRVAIRHALDIAAAAPSHPGVEAAVQE